MKESRPDKRIRNYSLRIIVPVVLTISAFVISIWVVFIPAFQKNLMESKKEMIQELTRSTWSILHELNKEVEKEEISLVKAQKEAKQIIKWLRYGDENKDYFWITNRVPEMIVHPYRPELEGSDLSDYQDPEGKKLFVESVAIARNQGEGYLDYIWQWKDDSTRLVPKISYVKVFRPWDWIIGTGIYVEDVKEEIARLKSWLVWLFLGISIFIAGILFYVLRIGLRIENRRKTAELALRHSREEYRSLVEASTEGSILVFDNRISYQNPMILKLLDYNQSAFSKLDPSALFYETSAGSSGYDEYLDFLEKDEPTRQFEAIWKKSDGSPIEVFLTVSRISIESRQGLIFIVKDISGARTSSRQTEKLAEDIQTSVLLMNQSVRHFSRDPVSAGYKTAVWKVAKLMEDSAVSAVIIKNDQDEIVGIITDSDIRNRLVGDRLNPDTPVFKIMSSPVRTLPGESPVYEAMIRMQEKGISNLALTGTKEEIRGIINKKDLIFLQQSSSVYLIHEIETAQTLVRLKNIHHKLQSLIQVLLSSGANSATCTRLISETSDAITRRIIRLVMEEMGPAPADFALIAMGSEGRKEQTLSTDQDNALIIEDKETLSKADRQYFLDLGKKVNDGLNQVGYQFCPGNNMAGNPKWNTTVREWENYFTNWIQQANPKDLLDTSIFFDFELLYGSDKLVDKVDHHVRDKMTHKAVFLYHMAQQALSFKVPSDIFGNISFKSNVNGQKGFEVKKAMMPVIDFARVYAMKTGIRERNTLNRLKEISEEKMINPDLSEEIRQAYSELMLIRLQHQSEQIRKGQAPDNFILETELTDIDISMLKKIFSVIHEIQNQIKMDFHLNA